MIDALRGVMAPGQGWRVRLFGSTTRQHLGWATLGAVAAKGGQAIGMMVAARLLGPEEFGRLGLLYVTAFLLYSVIGSGIGSNLVRFVARDRSDDRDRAARMVAAVRAWTLLGSLAAVLAVVVLGDRLPAILPGIAPGPLVWMGLAYALLMLQAEVEGAVVMAFQAFRSRAVVEVATGIIALLAIAGGAWTAGLVGAFAGLTVTALAWFAGNALVAAGTLRRHGIRRAWLPRAADLRHVASEVVPLSLAGIVVMAVTWATQLMLSHRPGGLVELGIFSAARQWLVLASFLPLILARVVLPTQVEVAADPRAGRDYARRQARHALWMTLPPALLIALASPLIMLLYGPGFASGWPVLVVLMLTIVAQAPSGVIQNHLVANGRSAGVLRINIVWGALTLTLTYVLLDHGALGLATALLASQIVRNILLRVLVVQ